MSVAVAVAEAVALAAAVGLLLQQETCQIDVLSSGTLKELLKPHENHKEY